MESMEEDDNDQWALQALMDDSAAEVLADCPWAMKNDDDGRPRDARFGVRSHFGSSCLGSSGFSLCFSGHGLELK